MSILFIILSWIEYLQNTYNLLYYGRMQRIRRKSNLEWKRPFRKDWGQVDPTFHENTRVSYK